MQAWSPFVMEGHDTRFSTLMFCPYNIDVVYRQK